MQNIKETLIIAIFSLLIIAFPDLCYSIEIGVGANIMYAWNNPSYVDELKGKSGTPYDGPGKGEAYDFEFDNNDGKGEFYIGPILSVTLTESLTLGALFILSTEYEVRGSYKIDSDPSAYTIHHTNTLNLRRYDSDISLSYKLLENIKPFIGMKYFGYSGSGTWKYYITGVSTASGEGNMTREGYFYGPALGIGLSFKVYGNLFSGINVSGSYLKSKAEFFTEEEAGDTRETIEGYKYSYNATASLSYYISSIDTVISLGGRYNNYYDKDDTGSQDEFYGITFSFLYYL